MLLSMTAAGLASVSCNTYNKSLLGGGPDAGKSVDCHWGGCWWSKKTPQGCQDVSTPIDSERPKNAPAGQDIDIYLGMTKVYLGETMPPGTAPSKGDGTPPASVAPDQLFGLDLDGLCTNPVSCLAAPRDQVGCKSGSGIPADGQGCRDNVFAAFEPIAANDPSLGKPFGFNENDFDCELYRGGFNILFKISQYNGQPNDDQVRLDLYMSPGLDKTLPTWKCIGDASWKGQTPWLPSQAWLVDQAGLSAPHPTAGPLPDAKHVYDAAAYVRSGYLVAHIPNGETLRFIGDQTAHHGIAIIVYQGLVTAHLFKNQDSLWAMDDALITGRIKRDDMERSFNDIGYCSAAGTPPGKVPAAKYQVLSKYLDANMDVLSNGANTASALCDAMSMGLGFKAIAVTPGRAVKVSTLQKCGDPVGPYTPP